MVGGSPNSHESGYREILDSNWTLRLSHQFDIVESVERLQGKAEH